MSPFWPFIRTKSVHQVLKQVVLILRRKGIRLIIYLDDILLMNSCSLALQDNLRETVQLLISLGFIVNWEKSVCSPTQRIEYLGLTINSRELSFALPQSKLLSIAQQCQAILRSNHCVLRSLASILGLLSWSVSAVPFAQAHFRAIQALFITTLAKENGDLSKSATLSEAGLGVVVIGGRGG